MAVVDHFCSASNAATSHPTTVQKSAPRKGSCAIGGHLSPQMTADNEFMPSPRKLTRYAKNQFCGPKRKKPKVREANRAVARQIKQENDLILALLRDVDARRQVIGVPDGQRDPLIVWKDFAQTWEYTEIDTSKLPTWDKLGEYIKIHLLFQIVLMEGGYSFTVKVRPDLEARWMDGNGLDRIRRETREAIRNEGLDELEYLYVVEGGTKRGGKTGLHLHGFFLAHDPRIATKFKIAMEQSIATHPSGKVAAGFSPKSGAPIVIEPSYAKSTDDVDGRIVWPDYIIKHIRKGDKRLVGKRRYMSQTATQTVRAFWELIREGNDLDYLDLSY